MGWKNGTLSSLIFTFKESDRDGHLFCAVHRHELIKDFSQSFSRPFSLFQKHKIKIEDEKQIQ